MLMAPDDFDEDFLSPDDRSDLAWVGLLCLVVSAGFVIWLGCLLWPCVACLL